MKTRIQEDRIDWELMAEELLDALIWGLGVAMHPTLPHILGWCGNPSQEGRLRSHLRRLEEKRLLRREKRADQMVFRLTDAGQLAVWGGRDPQTRWNRRWDGSWRMVFFDLPESRQATRCRLLRWLHQNDFGFLQQSVWVRPDPIEKFSAALDDFRDDVESLTLMNADCCRGYSNAAIVKGAWDFVEINNGYRQYLSMVSKRQRVLGRAEVARRDQLQALQVERHLWKKAILADPLLPRVLWPKGYLGEEAWKRRRDILGL